MFAAPITNWTHITVVYRDNQPSLYLNGKFVETKATIPVRNPATGEIFAQMSSCGRETVAKAIEDAHAAFGSSERSGALRFVRTR